MKVLITSKTRAGSKFCVGALELETNEYVRLLTTTGNFQPHNTPFKIGDIWDLEYNYDPDDRPHIEDVKITSRNGYIDHLEDIREHIYNNCKIWEGDYNVLFDNALRWTSGGSGYINKKCEMPQNSVGFWICDQDLSLIEEGNKFYYVYERGRFRTNRRLVYKGESAPVKVILQGTLIRVSLAKWYAPDDIKIEKRCYAQLSGFYSK